MLDLGCGWGAVSIALARSCGEVASLDLTRERVLSLKALAKFEGLDNLTFVHGGDGALPFPDGHFDAVVLNGVLEWVPENRVGDPRQVQIGFLREAARTLKPNGVLYVAIENRLAARYVVKREDHVGLYWSSFMPRRVSNAYSRLMRGKPYRTYTYSIQGYQRLFAAAGLRSTRFVCPLPDYRYPKQLKNIERDPNWPETEISRRRSYFAHSFSILASPSATPPFPLHQLLETLRTHVDAQQLACEQYLVRKCAALLFLRTDDGPRFVARFCTDPGSRFVRGEMPWRCGS